MKLTPRQRQILDLIRVRIDETGFPPTRAEIAAAFGFRSANAAEEHLRALARKGEIALQKGLPAASGCYNSRRGRSGECRSSAGWPQAVRFWRRSISRSAIAWIHGCFVRVPIIC